MRRPLVLLVLMLVLLLSCASAEKTLTLTFTGDVTLGSEEVKRNKEWSFDSVAAEKGYDYFFANVRDFFAEDDLTVINFEGVLSDSAKQENTKKTYRFRGPVDFAKILPPANIDACTVANNHSHDFGDQGYESTLAALEGAGLGVFGGTKSWIWEKDGIRIAFFGFNSTQFNSSRKWVGEEIARLKAEEGVNAVIFVCHAGTEYGRVRNNIQQTYAEWAIDKGADLVIMHHPHVVQGIDIYQNRTICYSLGNFCFGGNKEVREGALYCLIARVHLTFDDSGVYTGQQIDLYPGNISGTDPVNNYQPLLVRTAAEAQLVFDRVQRDTHFDLPAFSEETGCVSLPALPAQE